jgi:archaellum component FlaC
MTADERFDRLEQLIENLTRHSDERFARIDERFDRVDQRFDRIDHSVENLTERVDRLEASVQNLTRYFMDFRSEALGRFQAIEARLDVPMSIAAKAEAQMSQVSTLTKAVTDLGAVTTQLSATQWKHTDNTFDLEKRVAKLEEIVSKLAKPAA